ncbi:MAG: sigma 54-interacting transcriptional regulator [Deltaproteobacteria bacterium]|nr:sigma 54-interacting transcriptional regulator [Deltaproteobacteria bacterium]
MEKIGCYQLLRVVGEGAEAQVYQAQKENQLYALKIPKVSDPRFLFEFETLQKLKSSAWLKAQEHLHFKNQDYFVYEWVSATTLAEQPSLLLEKDWEDFIVQCLQAISELHQLQIFHADLKLENIFYQKPFVKIFDLGLAQSHQGPLSENWKGSLAYMAPELLIGKNPSEKSDLYAFGMILWRWAVGRFPFDSQKPNEVIRWHLLENPRHPQAFVSTFSKKVGDFILLLLEKDPQNRPLNATLALKSFLNEEIIDEVEEGKSFYGEAIQFYQQKSFLTKDEQLLLAELLYRQGDLESALSQAHAIKSVDSDILQARILTRLGRFEEAEKILKNIEETTDHPFTEENKVVFYNAWGTLYYYQSQFEESLRMFSQAEELAEKITDKQWLASTLNNRANLELERGDSSKALQYYERSILCARELGDRIHEGMFTMSLGYFYHRQQKFSQAFPYYQESIQILNNIGQKVEKARVQLNLANLLMVMGDHEGALQNLEKVILFFQKRKLSFLFKQALFLKGDLIRKSGDPATALEIFRDLEQEFIQDLSKEEFYKLQLHQLECCIDSESLDESLVKKLNESLKNSDIDWVQAYHLLILIRLLWRNESSFEELEKKCLELNEKYLSFLDSEAVFQFYYLYGAILFSFQKKDASKFYLIKSQQMLQERLQQIPSEYQTSFLKKSPDENIERMLKMENPRLPLSWKDATDSPISFFETQLEHLQKEMVGELDLTTLVEKVLDKMIDLTQAERGFLLLNEMPDPRLAVSRNLDLNEKGSDSPVSFSIAQEAIQTRKPIITLDALTDDRFLATTSVHALQLRSILCVPFQNGSEVLGAIYLDHRDRRGVFPLELGNALKPFANFVGKLLANAKRFFEVENRLRQTEEKLSAIQSELHLKYDYKNIVGQHPKMKEIFQLLDRVTDVEIPVMILGESGTGKELIAKALHYHGPRAKRPFISMNCQAIPESLFESELFGHVRGAFTGAAQDRIGLVEQAHQGTLFLDEIGDLPLAMQGKLLRVLQEKSIRRIGDKQERAVDIRVVAATHCDLREMIRKKVFREDLWYRLNVVEVHLPPLRDRKEDLPLLVNHFMKQFSERHGGKVKKVKSEVWDLLGQYDWPGNIRELENTLTNACVFSEGDLLTVDCFRYKKELSKNSEEKKVSRLPEKRISHFSSFEEAKILFEKQILSEALSDSGGNITKASERLKIARPQLSRWIKKYKIKTPS